MSDPGTYPTPPPADGYGQTTPAEPPPSIKTAVSIVWAVIALSVVSTILTFVMLDDVIEAAGVKATSGPEYDGARTGAVVGAIIGFLVFGALWVLLGVFLRKGANWARIVLTVLAVIGLGFGVFGLTLGEQPAIFLVITIVQMALYAGLLFFMWRRDSSDYIAAAKAR